MSLQDSYNNFTSSSNSLISLIEGILSNGEFTEEDKNNLNNLKIGYNSSYIDVKEELQYASNIELEKKIIEVSSKNSDLSQSDVFNALTNGGQAQGVFIDEETGEVYINAEFLQARGLRVVNDDDEQTLYINKNGNLTTSGDIVGGTITGTKLQALTIDTNEVNIESKDGGMVLKGALQKFTDENGKVRILIGKDTDNKFKFLLFGENGETILIDKDGIKADAIASGTIIGTHIKADSISTKHLKAEVLETVDAHIENLTANKLEAKDLDAINASIKNLSTDKLSADEAELKFANIDLSNIGTGVIGTGLIAVGAIKTAQIADASITDAKIVQLTADKINAGTLSCDRLLINGTGKNGEKSILFTLNNLGELVSQNVDTLDGDVLTPKSITADKIVAKSITSSEIASSTITANEIASNTIKAGNLQAGTITSESACIGSLNASKIITGTIDATKVTVTNLNASNITTGTIDAAKITVINLNASNIKTGTLDATKVTVANLNASNITGGTINANLISADTLRGKTIIGGTIDGGILKSQKSVTGGTNKVHIEGAKIVSSITSTSEIQSVEIEGNTIVLQQTYTATMGKGTKTEIDYTGVTVYNEDGSDKAVQLYSHGNANGGNVGYFNGNVQVVKNLKVGGTITGSLSGNANTATTLQNTRTINGTNFNGSGNITTANWGTARNITIGKTAKSVNGSGNVAWSLSEIGALATTGGTISGALEVTGGVKSTGIRSSGELILACDNANIDYTGNASSRIRYRVSSGNYYFDPHMNNTVRLGSTTYSWNVVYAQNGVNTTSDRNFKENIKYINKNSDCFSNSDMYKFIKEDYLLAQYNYIGDKVDDEKISAIAQDLLVNTDGTDNELGQLVVNYKDAVKNNIEGESPKLSISQVQLLNIAIGALQQAMLKIEELEKRIGEII